MSQVILLIPGMPYPVVDTRQSLEKQILLNDYSFWREKFQEQYFQRS